MHKDARHAGRLIRKIRRIDMAWRRAGQPEGRLENRLAFELGNAARFAPGLGAKSRRVQIRNARQLGQRSSWETVTV